jgi:hypothetical protein
VNERQFFQEVMTILITMDPDRLRTCHEITLGFLMDWLYPHAGSENN